MEKSSERGTLNKMHATRKKKKGNEQTESKKKVKGFEVRKERRKKKKRGKNSKECKRKKKMYCKLYNKIDFLFFL